MLDESPKYSDADLRDLLLRLLTMEPEKFMAFRSYLLQGGSVRPHSPQKKIHFL